MWILASSQSTSCPSIQILSTLVMGMPLRLLRDVLGDQIANFSRRVSHRGSRRAAQLGEYGPYGPFDPIGGAVLPDEAGQHPRRQDGGQRVGFAGAGDVGGRAVNGLEQARSFPRWVEVAGGGQAHTAGHRRPEVGEDVAEQVVG